VSDEGPWRWCLRMEYDGTSFVGWQRQPDQRSVQGVVEEAVVHLFGHPAVVTACGRTDAGVHALSQIVAFTTSTRRSATEVCHGLNAALPDDVAVVTAEPVPLNFEARHWVSYKEYRYLLLNRLGRSPLLDGRSWHVRRDLDLDAMRAASEHLVGKHDFSAFQASGCQATHPVRTIESIRIERAGELVTISVVGHGFLRHMVRIIVGSLVDIGLGRQSSTWMLDVLNGRDRTKAGRTAPAKGLVLASVELGTGPYPRR